MVFISPYHKAGYFLGVCTWPGGGWLMSRDTCPQNSNFQFFWNALEIHYENQDKKHPEVFQVSLPRDWRIIF